MQYNHQSIITTTSQFTTFPREYYHKKIFFCTNLTNKTEYDDLNNKKHHDLQTYRSEKKDKIQTQIMESIQKTRSKTDQHSHRVGNQSKTGKESKPLPRNIRGGTTRKPRLLGRNRHLNQKIGREASR